MVNVKYYSNFDHFLNAPTGEVGQNLRKRGKYIITKAKAQVGVDTGRLRSSIHMIHTRAGSEQVLWIGSRERHALLHHEGTRAHMVVPRSQQILRYGTQGRVVYSRSVKHPGTKANHYLSDQLRFAFVR